MKICPKCNTNYDDDTLNFCLEDGTMLTTATNQMPSPPATVMVQPTASDPNTPYPTNVNRGEVATAPAIPTRRKSRGVLWVLGILGAVVVLCGGGFAGLVAIGLLTDDEKEPPANVAETETTRTPESSVGDPSRQLKTSIDPKSWAGNIKGKGITAASTSEGLELRSVKGYFYVILTDSDMTYNRSTLLRVKNVTGKAAGSGYGLVIHSYADSVLERDYALVIRSDNGTFRIIRHENKKERNLVNWTKSTAIKRGTESNDLEIRATEDRLRFYINGELVKALRDYTNYKKGVAGVYTSDDIPIAFQKIEIRE